MAKKRLKIKKKKKSKQRGRKIKLTKRLRIPKINQELSLKSKGFHRVAGVDEVGRGSLAGPVVAAAVILPKDKRLYQLRDSKLLTSTEREKIARKIRKRSQVGIGSVSNEKIDQIGLHRATLLAFKKAVTRLGRKPDFILIDAFKIPNIDIPQKSVKKGDMVCASIAAASICAKVYRDRIMRGISRRSKYYRKYHFEKHKGYGTKLHQKLLKKYGPTKLHRKSFQPIKRLIK